MILELFLEVLNIITIPAGLQCAEEPDMLAETSYDKARTTEHHGMV